MGGSDLVSAERYMAAADTKKTVKPEEDDQLDSEEADAMYDVAGRSSPQYIKDAIAEGLQKDADSAKRPCEHDKTISAESADCIDKKEHSVPQLKQPDAEADVAKAPSDDAKGSYDEADAVDEDGPVDSYCLLDHTLPS